MKRLILILILTLPTLAFSQGMFNIFEAFGKGSYSHNRAFESENSYLSISPFIGRLDGLGKLPENHRLKLGIDVSNEYSILGDYVSLGYDIGYAFTRNQKPYIRSTDIFYIGVLSNFHFYELLRDKRKLKNYNEELDIYIGGSIGFRTITSKWNENQIGHKTNKVSGHYSAHFGFRWYPDNSSFGLQSEIGYGKSIISLGLIIR